MTLLIVTSTSFIFGGLLYLAFDLIPKLPQLLKSFLTRYLLDFTSLTLSNLLLYYYRMMQSIMLLSVLSTFVFYYDFTFMLLILAPSLCALQWAVMFLIELIGISHWDVKVILYLIICFIMIYITCTRVEVLAIFFVLCPAVNLTLLPQLLTSTGLKYWKSTTSDYLYFIYVSFGYWDSNGTAAATFQVEQKVKTFNSTSSSTRQARGHYTNSSSATSSESKGEKKESENSLELEESYYYFNHVISSTIGTRVLLLMIFKILTPIALYVRYTCPYPIFVYDEKLLKRSVL